MVRTVQRLLGHALSQPYLAKRNMLRFMFSDNEDMANDKQG